MVQRSIVSILMCVLCAATASAQTVTMSGRVADPQGGEVSGATVTLVGPGAKQVATAQTGADGRFSLAAPAGSYDLQVEARGFDRAVRRVTLASGMAPLEIALALAGLTESVVVAAPRLEEGLPQEIERAGVRVQTITSAQIENGGYYDVGQVLQALVPGLFLTPHNGPFSYVSASLQGSRVNEILWLVDGVRISNRLYNGTTPLDTLPAHMIERIEVLEGGQGLFYGTQAVSGVINVVTKAFTESANGRLQTGFDTNDGRHVNVYARDTLRGHRLVFYGSSDRAEGFEAFPETEFQPSSTDRHRSYDVLMAGLKYAYDFSDAWRVSGMYQRSDVTLDLLRPGRSGATQSGGVAERFNAREEHIASAKVDFTPRESFSLFFKGYYHRWDTDYNETRNVIGSPGTRQVISDDEFWGFTDYGANLLAKFAPTRQVEYFAGYDLQNYSGEDEVLLIAPNTERVHAVFGQVRTTRDLLGKATLAFGVRYNEPTHSEGALVWNASGRYDFTPNLFTRATVGTAFRYPDAYELFAIDPTCCFGNPDLEPERSTNVNASLGARLVSGATRFDVEGIFFYREVSDLIVDVDDGSGETTITANRPDEVRVRGVTLAGSASFTETVSGSLGYTYTNSERTSEIAGGYSALPGIPSNQVQGSLDLHPRVQPFGATFTVSWVGEMFDNVAGFGSVPGGEYVIADLSGRVYLDRSRRHRINVRLENLFDEDYTTIHTRSFTDDTGTPFLVHTLGTPRTLHVSYSFSY